MAKTSQLREAYTKSLSAIELSLQSLKDLQARIGDTARAGKAELTELITERQQKATQVERLYKVFQTEMSKYREHLDSADSPDDADDDQDSEDDVPLCLSYKPNAKPKPNPKTEDLPQLEQLCKEAFEIRASLEGLAHVTGSAHQTVDEFRSSLKQNAKQAAEDCKSGKGERWPFLQLHRKQIEFESAAAQEACALKRRVLATKSKSEKLRKLPETFSAWLQSKQLEPQGDEAKVVEQQYKDKVAPLLATGTNSPDSRKRLRPKMLCLTQTKDKELP